MMNKYESAVGEDKPEEVQCDVMKYNESSVGGDKLDKYEVMNYNESSVGEDKTDEAQCKMMKYTSPQ